MHTENERENQAPSYGEIFKGLKTLSCQTGWERPEFTFREQKDSFCQGIENLPFITKGETGQFTMLILLKKNAFLTQRQCVRQPILLRFLIPEWSKTRESARHSGLIAI